MQRYLLSRVIQSIFLLFGVLVVVFFLVRLTGDPTSLMVAKEAPAEQREAFREAMGFNRPLPIQFLDFAGDILRGDFGNSLHFRQPALDLILERLPATFYLATTALLFAIVIAVPIGIIGGSNPGSAMDSLGRALGLLGQTIPNFWLALILILIFAVNLGWFPSFGRDSAISVVLPAVALGFGSMGQLVRLTRSAVLEIRNEDYIRTARSKGISQFKIGARHVFRNASLALVSVISIQYSYLLGGSIYIETIFSWPGLGNLLQQAVDGRDFPLVQAIAFFISFFVIALTLLTDVAYALIDPRIRYSS
ncbi:MAG: ABC transporter permease [Chloroflexi bacterium]|nr:MAG: ABC transporter permease [Chloroflexota bacterium]